jgi:hypothetical protein
MIAHVVLFTPRQTLSAGERQALADTFAAALVAIPSIRRARVGHRVTHGRPGYEQLMRVHYEYAAIVEFDDRAGLEAYLAHSAHQALGERFFAMFEEALMYDFELEEGAAGIASALERSR